MSHSSCVVPIYLKCPFLSCSCLTIHSRFPTQSIANGFFMLWHLSFKSYILRTNSFHRFWGHLYTVHANITVVCFCFQYVRVVCVWWLSLSHAITIFNWIYASQIGLCIAIKKRPVSVKLKLSSCFASIHLIYLQHATMILHAFKLRDFKR